MRIAQLTPFYSPHHGGVESFVRDISVELVKRGHDVTVFTSKYDKSLRQDEVMEGVRVIRVPLLATVLRTPIPRGLTKIMAGWDFDVVHTHTPPPTFAYMPARQMEKAGMPTVVTYHCDSDIPSRLTSPFVRLIDRFVTRRIIDSATQVLVTTRTYSSTSSNVWKITPEIVPVSADTSRFYPDGADREKTRRKFHLSGRRVILFVGRLVRHKGVQYLIEAMRYLDRECMLLVVGDGDYSSSLKRLVVAHSLTDRVMLLGDVPDSILPSIYRAADIAVVPSTSRLEAFSIAAIESMASGTPVLVSNIPGVREVIEEGRQGMRSEPMDPRDIADKLKGMLSDGSLLKQMGENGVQRAAGFSSSSVTSTMLSIYGRVTGSDD